MCILRNGTILLYRDLKEELFDPASDDAMRAGPLPVLSNIFSLCSAAQHIDDDDDDVHLVHHWRGGAVILTDKMRILCVFVLDGGEFHIDDFGRLPINPAKPPRCMAVLCPEIACHKSVDEMEIAIALGERSGILIVSNSGEGVEARVPTFEADAAVCLAAHPTDRFLAVFGMNGFLHVVPVEFDKHIICQNCTDEICDATTLKTEFPTSVCWMGTSDAIAVFWNMAPWNREPRSGVVIVTQTLDPEAEGFHEAVRFLLEDDDAVITGAITGVVWEVDGVRVVGPRAAHMISRVPEYLDSMLAIGSYDPAAMLLYAAEAVDSGQPFSETALDELSGVPEDLEVAIFDCLGAAEFMVFDDELRRQLITAASIGKESSVSYSHKGELPKRLSAAFVASCKSCRTCVALKTMGTTFLTCAQLAGATSRVIIDRIAVLGKYYDALKLCKVASLPAASIFLQWAAAKVAQSTDESSTIMKAVVDRLETCDEWNVSYLYSWAAEAEGPVEVLESRELRKERASARLSKSFPWPWRAPSMHLLRDA